MKHLRRITVLTVALSIPLLAQAIPSSSQATASVVFASNQLSHPAVIASKHIKQSIKSADRRGVTKTMVASVAYGDGFWWSWYNF